jgi:hypothetical protein
MEPERKGMNAMKATMMTAQRTPQTREDMIALACAIRAEMKSLNRHMRDILAAAEIRKAA